MPVVVGDWSLGVFGKLIFLASIYVSLLVGCYQSTPISGTDTSSSDSDTGTDTGSESELVCDPDIEYIICEDFESFEVGDYYVESVGDPWEVWPGGEDVQVSDGQSVSGTKSLHVVDNADVAFHCNFYSGEYQLDFALYLEEDKGGFFAIYEAFTGGGPGGMRIFFFPGGSGELNTLEGNMAVEDVVPFEFDTGQWMNCSITIDVDEDTAQLSLAGTVIHTWAWTQGSSPPGEISFFEFWGNPDPSGAGLYMDDLKMREL